jgi:polysaccharide deacetylase family protein (PEP-CTERM system associated)
VVASTQRVLALLDRHQVAGTFFVLGWVARRFPDLVRSIARAGHEVGSHSYWHRLVYEQTPEAFRSDLRESKAVIEDTLGQPVRCYRAPTFSIVKTSLWALNILAEEGIQHDSSIFPIHHDRYGIPGYPTVPHAISTPAGRLLEFPMSTVRVLRRNLPVAGGGYFRLYPLRISLRLLNRLNRQGTPFVFYIHPWELDPEQPRMTVGSAKTRFRHYVNLGSTERKLDRLLPRFRFGQLPTSLHAAIESSQSDGSSCAERTRSPAELAAAPPR